MSWKVLRKMKSSVLSQIRLLPVVLPVLVAVGQREDAEIHRAHVERAHLRLGRSGAASRSSHGHVERAAGGDVDHRVGRLLDARQELHEHRRVRRRLAGLRVARMQMEDRRPRPRRRRSPCSAISSGVIGKASDIVGVWMAPVTAQLMMTFRDFTMSKSLPHQCAIGRPATGDRKYGNPGPPEAADIDRPQIRAAEGHAGEPRSDRAAAREHQFRRRLVAREGVHQRPARRTVVIVIEKDAQIALRGDGEDAVRHHVGAPEIAVGVEGDAVDEGAVVGGAEDFAVGEASVIRHPKPGDPAGAGFGHVEPFLASVEPDLVGEVEAVRHDAQAASACLGIVEGDEAVHDGRADRPHPVLRPGRNRKPEPVAAVAQDEIDLADRFAVDRIDQNPGLAVACHHLQPVGAEIGDQDIAVAGEGETVRQSAGDEAGLVIGGRRKGRSRPAG